MPRPSGDHGYHARVARREAQDAGSLGVVERVEDDGRGAEERHGWKVALRPEALKAHEALETLEALKTLGRQRLQRF